MDDAISRRAVLDILSNEFDMAAEERAEADNEKDRTFNAGEINCARRSTRKVNELPALDVAPVVHARWVRDDLMNARCSNCHTRLSFRHCYDEEDDYEWDDEIEETPWCMHCGARMDGEENAAD